MSHTVSEYATYNRLCKSLDGEEIYRAYTIGNDPKRQVGHNLNVSVDVED